MAFWKKKKEKDDYYLVEERLIDLDEFDELEEEDAKNNEMSIEEYERSFIYQFDDACPICHGPVKGNDHYKYYCKNCNILFTKKDLRLKSFGKHGDEKIHTHTRKLSPEQRAILQDKKKALMERIEKVFGEDTGHPEVKGPEEKEDISTEDEVVETQEPEGLEKEKSEKPDLDAISGMMHPGVQEAEFEEIEPKTEELEDTGDEETEGPEEEPTETEPEEDETEEPEEEPEYELEEEDRIIASKESTKIHKGTCHFVKKIHPENRIYFDTIEEGEEKGYEMCVCLRRLIAKQKAEEAQSK